MAVFSYCILPRSPSRIVLGGKAQIVNLRWGWIFEASAVNRLSLQATVVYYRAAGDWQTSQFYRVEVHRYWMAINRISGYLGFLCLIKSNSSFNGLLPTPGSRDDER